MLEFENEQAPVKATAEVPEGFVVVPLERYNELLLAANSMPTLRIKRSIFSKAHIDIEIDRDWLYYTALELLKLRYTPEELDAWDVVPIDDVYVSDVTIARCKPTEPTRPTPITGPDPF